jgi:PAS domain S-box-containing protein
MRTIGGRAPLPELRATLDALPQEAVLLDAHGVIVFANQAWREFADAHGCRSARDGVGLNYLTVCEAAVGSDAIDAAEVANGIRAVLAGEIARFTHEYCCAAGEQATWFVLNASRIAGRSAPYALVTHEDITARKGAEATLRFSLDRFQAFMDNSPAVAFLKDVTGRLVWINRPFAERFGQPMEEILGLSDEDFAPESAAELRRNDLAVLAADRPVQLRETMRTQHGTTEWLVMKFPVLDITGTRLIGGIAVDVTIEHQATAALRDSEARLRLMADQLPAIVVTTDRALRFTSAIGAGLDSVGLSPAQLLGRTAREVFGVLPGNRAAIEALPRALAGESLSLDAEWGGRDFQVRAEPVRDADGAIAGIVAVAVDFTERKQALRERADNAARMTTLAEVSNACAAARLDTRAVVDTTVQVISETMRDGCMVTLADPRTGKLKLYALHHADPAAREMVERLMLDTPADDDGEVSARVLRDGKPLRVWLPDLGMVPRVIAPEHRVYLERYPTYGLLCVPLRVEGAGIGVLAVWRDRPDQPYTTEDEVLLQNLADRAALAIANARIYEDVERRVHERTAALEASNRELEAFSYSVSHDLRAPLRAILSYSQVLEEECGALLDDEGRRYLSWVMAGGRRMENLIDALLRLSQISRTTISRRSVAIGALARDIGEELRRQEPQRNVTLTVDAERIVYADERLLRVVLENLLGNAWKYTAKRDAARISLGLQPAGSDGQPVYFVRDDGAGFDMRYAGKLFEAFQRLHPASEFSGSGIGLATVQRIIQRHGGRIWAEAAPEQGATFYFTVPPA